MKRKFEHFHLSGNGFNVQFEPFINNTVSRSWTYDIDERQINSLYGQVEVGFNGYLYVTASARNDWFSVLNPDVNSILYPSVGVSFVFSDMIQSLPSWFSFGKVRASWAQVGNVTINPYDVNLTYSLKGWDHLGRAVASISGAGGNNGNIPNPLLKPLLSTELEFGFDVRFFQNRLGVDFAYYDQTTTDDILNASIAMTSGFGSTSVNLGEMENKGIELMLTATPVTGALTWDISFNAARNKNKVVSLIEGTDELLVEEPRSRFVYIKHIVGQPYGVITGRVQMMHDGQPVFYENGRMRATGDFQIVGNGNPDWTGGINNSFTWKNINLSFLIDFKIGGDIYSGSNARLTSAGVTKRSLEGRVGKDPIHVTGVVEQADGSFAPIDRDLTPNEARNYWSGSQGDQDGIAPLWITDAGFGKLRQLVLGYNFPRSLLDKTPFNSLSLSFVGRNLLVLWKDIDNVDPESSYSTSNGQGLEYFSMPSVRSYGFDLKVGF